MLRKCVDLANEVRGLLKVLGIKLRAGIRHGAFDAASRGPLLSRPHPHDKGRSVGIALSLGDQAGQGKGWAPRPCGNRPQACRHPARMWCDRSAFSYRASEAAQ